MDGIIIKNNVSVYYERNRKGSRSSRESGDTCKIQRKDWYRIKTKVVVSLEGSRIVIIPQNKQCALCGNIIE